MTVIAKKEYMFTKSLYIAEINAPTIDENIGHLNVIVKQLLYRNMLYNAIKWTSEIRFVIDLDGSSQHFT
jgi:hypothetical protein